MDRLHISLVVLLGVVSSNPDWISGSVLEVKPGDNITLYCDCRLSTGVYIVWFRNCSHENQPSLVLHVIRDARRPTTVADILNPLPRFYFVRNYSSNSYDLQITNTTDSDEGLYYCGTEQKRVEDKVHISNTYAYQYGNVTRILFNSSKPYLITQDCGLCLMLLYFLCPTCAVLSSVLSSLLVYYLCQKTAKEPKVDKRRNDSTETPSVNTDDDVFYAAVVIHPTSQRPKKKKKIQSSDFTTYSNINTCRM